jgi:hypothetical protein
MLRSFPIAALAVILLLSACRALAPAARPTPEVPAATPQPSVCFLGGGVSEVSYSDISELARSADSIAIAEVVEVGELEYSTETGERPSCEYMAAAQGSFAVGRMIELREARNVAGRARATETFFYWLRGGALGGDTSPGHHFGLHTPKVGDRMLAFLLAEPADLDVGPGVREVHVYELMAIGSDGMIITPNPQESITVDNVDTAVDESVQAP